MNYFKKKPFENKKFYERSQIYFINLFNFSSFLFSDYHQNAFKKITHISKATSTIMILKFAVHL